MKSEFDEVWERIKSETELKSLKNLAATVKISQQAVSEMKSKGKFPPGWAYLVGEQFNLLTEWLMKGTGPRRLSDQKTISRKYEILNEAEEWLNEEVRRNPDRKIWFELHLLDSFPGFKKWRQKRGAKEDSKDSSPERKVA